MATLPFVLNFLGVSGDEMMYGKDYITTVLYGGVFWIAGLAYNMIDIRHIEFRKESRYPGFYYRSDYPTCDDETL